MFMMPIGEERICAYASLLGVSSDELEDFLFYVYIDTQYEIPKDLWNANPSYSRGRVIFDRVDKTLGGCRVQSEDRVKALRKKYVASLSRHKRNQTKYGV